MTATRGDVVGRVDALHESCPASAAAFTAEHGERVDDYRRLVSAGIDEALAELRAEMADASGGNALVTEIGEHLTGYVAWMQWSLWDLPVIAAAVEPDGDRFRHDVAGCGLVYIAIRMVDDVIDGHFSYKGVRDTFFGSVSETHGDAQRSRGLATLAALLLCFDGLDRLARADGLGGPTAGDVLRSLRRAVVGAMMEHTPEPRSSPDEYVRMVRLKNVDYWRALYAAVDPERQSPLYPFLERYYELAQYLNDVGDYEDDARRGQPNLLALHAAGGNGCRPVDDPRPWGVTDEVEELLAERVLELGALAAELPDVERAAAETKLADLLDDARAAGLFVESGAPDEPPEPEAEGREPEALELYPFSELADVVEQAGQDALVEVSCGTCGSDERRELFRKQGFRFHRCLACAHVYVSPRIRDDVQSRVGTELGRVDKYLEVQRIYAEHICHLLRQRTPGARLLDIGFGRGYLLQMAQVYGFEAYGLDASPAMVEPMRPLFADRVAEGMLGRDPLPWRSFDAVVLSHVLEHVGDPGAALAEVAAVLNPGAWIYLAVPDVESVDFRVFGKQWDAVNPLVHLQYFGEGSLTRLLERSGFERVERIRHPQLRDAVSPRWMRLWRQLGGSDSSELTMLATLPEEAF